MRGTKDRIVGAAVELFNRSGVGPVTTNHIAAHLGMSPGNLYYHFKNKAEIIRSAFDRMNAEADEVWTLDPALGPLALHRMLTGNIALYARYLFFARELPALLRADPALRRRYRKIHAQRLEQLEATLAPLVTLGLVKGVGPKDLHVLVESAWIIGLFGVPHAELTGGGAGAGDFMRAAGMVLHLFKPYMEPFAYDALVDIAQGELEKLVEKVPAEK